MSKFAQTVLRRIFATAVGVLAVAKFIVSLTPAGQDMKLWQILAIIALMWLAWVFALADYKDARKDAPKLSVDAKDQTKINDYMLKLLRHGGNVAIYSNNLTWVSKSKPIMALLSQKAGDKEVTILVPIENEVSRSLRDKGALVLAYPSLNVVPQVRFTMVFHGNADQWVAIGRREGGRHTIREYANGELPYFLAEDLIRVVKSCSETHEIASSVLLGKV